MPTWTHLKCSHGDSLGVLPEPPGGQVAEDHGEAVQVYGGLLLAVGGAGLSLESQATTPEDGLSVSFLCGVCMYMYN